MSSGTVAESLVIDSSVIVASHLPEEVNHLLGVEYMDRLHKGEYMFHLPMLVSVEVTAAIRRRLSNWQQVIEDWQRNLAGWEREGKVVLYPLDRARWERCVSAARRLRLRGADSVVASLDEELNMPFRTFYRELLERGPRAAL